MVDAPPSPFASAENTHLQNGPVGGTVVPPIQLPIRVCLRREARELLSQILLAIEGRKQNGHARTVNRRPLSCHRGCGLDIRDIYAKPWIATPQVLCGLLHQQVHRDHRLRDLHGVQGSAFPEVVGHTPER